MDQEEKRKRYKEALRLVGLEESTWSEAACVMAEAMAGCMGLAHLLAYGEVEIEAGDLCGLTGSEAQNVVALAVAMFDKLIVGMGPAVVRASNVPALRGN